MMNGTLFVDTDGEIRIFDIVVFEPHNCLAGEWEVLMPPIGDLDGKCTTLCCL